MHTADANSNVERPRGPAFSYAPGSRPLDGYVIKRGLGQGGFGEVYFAVSDAGKEVALKVVRRNLDVELRGVTQCLNLKHPNLVGLYDVRIDTEGNHWIVMEYVAGRRLVDVVADYPQGMPLEEALRWFRGIAAGTAYLHQSGIVHRDLKPANLFIENDIVKLGDYGLAKFISVSRRSGQTESVGTVHYMAPEIANGRYGKQIDIYALGVILYELTTGRVPFDGESVGEILMKHLTAEPDLSAVPAAVRPAVAAALAKDPEVRPKTVDELVAMVDGRPAPAVSAFPASSPPPVVRAAESDVKLLEPTLPHPAAAAVPSWYRPSVVGVTVFSALMTLFLARMMEEPGGRIVVIMVGVMWLLALVGITAVKNREMAAQKPGTRSKPGSSSEVAAAHPSPNWYVPIAFGLTAIAAMFGLAFLRGMGTNQHTPYAGNVQPTTSWGLLGVGVLWLAAMSYLNHLKNRYRREGTPHATSSRELASPHHGAPAGGPSSGVRLFWFGLVVVVVFCVCWMFAFYASHSVERSATLAYPTPPEAAPRPPIVVVPEVRPPVVVTPNLPTPPRIAPVPGPPMPNTPQQEFQHQVIGLAPISFVIIAAVAAGFGLWMYRVRLTLAREPHGGPAGDTASTMLPAVSRRAAAAEFAASIVVTLIATVVVGRIALLLRGDSAAVEAVLWLVVTSGLASSVLLVVERLFSGRPRDGWARRMPQAAAALPVGLASWGIARYLMIEFDRFDDLPQMVSPLQWPECFVGGQPLLLAHVAYFALVFFAAAWWRQTERRRSARLQISEIVLALLWAGVVNMFMPFPQPWGFLVVGTTATVVQFAAPWREAGVEKAIAARLRGRP